MTSDESQILSSLSFPRTRTLSSPDDLLSLSSVTPFPQPHPALCHHVKMFHLFPKSLIQAPRADRSLPCHLPDVTRPLSAPLLDGVLEHPCQAPGESLVPWTALRGDMTHSVQPRPCRHARIQPFRKASSRDGIWAVRHPLAVRPVSCVQ